MADEAEKLINLSLCKMAESRTVRRGGSSLHKHLLISTVLTKARSAYFETWYMGEGEVSDSSGGDVLDLNASYQELDFPFEDDDNEDLQEDSSTTADASASGFGPLCSENNDDVDSRLTTGDVPPENRQEQDPFLCRRKIEADIESEIELPSDILHCVEKMSGGMGEMGFPPAEESACIVSSTTSDSMVVSNVLKERSSDTLSSLTNSTDVSDDMIFGSPSVTSTPTSNKRRRTWSSDEEEESEEITEGSGQSNSPTWSGGRKKDGANFSTVAKRLRYSPDKELSGDASSSFPNDKEFPSLNITNNSEFRTKKSHFEEDDEQEDSEDDAAFLGDALNQSHYNVENEQHLPKRKNDQRVPSTSGGSSSDEDGDLVESMEVDQITNLVQFISFNKNQAKNKTAVPLSSAYSEDHVPVKSFSSTNLVRSMSSPDLCGLTASSKSVTSASKLLTVCSGNSTYLHLCI